MLISILLLAALSCKDKDPKAECGCGSPVIKEIKDVKASYLEDGKFLIRMTNPQGELYEEINISCTIDNAWIKTEDISKPDYEITARVKKGCEPPVYVSYFPGNSIEITKIKKTL